MLIGRGRAARPRPDTSTAHAKTAIRRLSHQHGAPFLREFEFDYTGTPTAPGRDAAALAPAPAGAPDARRAWYRRICLPVGARHEIAGSRIRPHSARGWSADGRRRFRSVRPRLRQRSQEPPQERPRIPDDSVELNVSGCLKGRVLAVSDTRETDTQSGPIVRGKSFRLAGKGDIMKEVKKEDGILRRGDRHREAVRARLERHQDRQAGRGRRRLAGRRHAQPCRSRSPTWR